MRRFFTCLCAAALLTLPMEPNGAVSRYAGRSTIIRSEFAPFPHKARRNGYRKKSKSGGKFYPYKGHYDDDAVLVRPSRRWSPDRPLRLVLYFHGWRNHIRQADEKFRISEQFDAAGLDAVLIMPQLARSAEDSFAGRFEDPGGFDRFIDDIRDRLARAHGIAPRVRPPLVEIVLAGHSGAYRPLAHILKKSPLAEKVSTVLLFDGMYAYPGVFADWLGDSPRRRFATVFTPYTRRGVARFRRRLERRGIDFKASNDRDRDVDRIQARILLLKSDGGHDQTVFEQNQLARLLVASRR